MFDHFGTSIGWLKTERKAKRRSYDLVPFLRDFGFRVYVKSMGCQTMGLPMYRIILQCINRYLGDVGRGECDK
jgi:hypothetical protein